MDYVALLTLRPTVSAAERDAGLMRRAAWTYPDGLEPIAEYWPLGDGPHVISIFSAENPAAIMGLYFEWNDIFDIQVSPAVSADEGLQLGPDVFGKLARMQPA